MIWVRGGRRPVSSEVRDGLQSGYWQWARSNRAPWRVSRSIFGVWTAAPWPAVGGVSLDQSYAKQLQFEEESR